MPISIIDNFGITIPGHSFHHQPCVPAPEWLASAVVYELYVRAFTSDGTLIAAREKLDDLKQLGINTIWLMPIYPIGKVRRKGPLGNPYAVRDHRRINPDLGNETHLKAFIERAHQLDIRVIFDWVANHGAHDHVELSSHPDWFMQDENGNFTRRISGWSDVIDFNYQQPSLRAYMKQAMFFWLNEFQIDGFRCDAAGMVPGDFWKDIYAELKSINSNAVLIAEWEAPALHTDAFHVTYNWSLYKKMAAIHDREADAQDAVHLLTESTQLYPLGAHRFHFLENHDQSRATYKFGARSFQPYALLIFTIPGIPLIFNGQEIGDPKFISLFDKSPINWKFRGGSKIRQFYSSLIKLRNEWPVFSDGSLSPIQHAYPRQLAAFQMKSDDNGAVVILNFSNETLPIDFELPLSASSWHVYTTDSMSTTVVSESALPMNIQPFQGLVYIPVT